MKTLYLVILALGFMTYVYGQDTMYIHQKDGNIVKYSIETIDSIVFYEKELIPESTTVEDYDGNVYNIVTIREQTWMSENLRVTHYADGTPIAHVVGNANWDTLDISDKAYCYPADDVNNAVPFGAFYTWNAACNGELSSNTNPSNLKGVCPDGWHLPSELEWEELEMALGMSSIDAQSTSWRGVSDKIGLKLKATDGWQSGNGTNESGFTARPAGYRGLNGVTYNQNIMGYWWSSTEHTLNVSAENRSLSAYSTGVNRLNAEMESGYSVRCVKDELK